LPVEEEAAGDAASKKGKSKANSKIVKDKNAEAERKVMLASEADLKAA